MFKLKSIDSFTVARGQIFIVESPVEAERECSAMLAALGPVIEIDGAKYEPLGFEWHVVATPVSIGERIAILVRAPEIAA